MKETTSMILPADDVAIARAVGILRRGGLIAIPTETVYGLAADAANSRAVARIFEVKGRPRFNPLICHVAGHAEAAMLVEIPPLAERLIDAFWPGPLTLVLEKLPDAPVADLVTAGLATLGVRAPAHPVASELLAAFGGALAAPSANRSGRVSPTRAEHVAADLDGDVDIILDGGPCTVGIESTIVSVRRGDVALLRPGGIGVEEIERVIGRSPVAGEGGRITAPGQLASHYAPRARLRLDAHTARPGEILIGFGEVAGDLSLSRGGDPVEAAAKLFATLRTADARGAAVIAVAPIPEHGLGRAINDRLRRAATPREGKGRG